MSKLKPKEKSFYLHFKNAADNLAAGAEALAEVTGKSVDRAVIATRMRELAAEGDLVTDALLATLHASFVTPFDRSEIQELSRALDDGIDHMEAAAGLIYLLDPPPLPAEAKTLTRILVDCAAATVIAVGKLKKLKGLRTFRAEIIRLEQEADQARRELLARLTGGEFNPLDAIKLKAIGDELTAAVAAFETVAEIVEAVIVKES